MGVINEDPSSTGGVVNIMMELHKYVLSCGDKLHTILCHGDQLSVERMLDARRAMSGGESPKGRLEGLEPCPQEFHRRCIVRQVQWIVYCVYS